MTVHPPLASLLSEPDYPNVTPIATISGSNTGLYVPGGIALDSSANIYVADYEANSVFVYSALGSSTGLLNEAPSAATISTTLTTGLSYTTGIALDYSGNIYVAGNDLNGVPSVFVYPAGSNANAAPTATISGSNTGLVYPWGMALDYSGNIYVVDKGATSVFVYPAGSNGNVSPIATIGDVFAGAIALDSSGNIYVVDWGSRQRGCLSAAGKQHRDALRGSRRHHQREQHRLVRPTRHRAGFQPQHLCDGTQAPRAY